MVTAYQGGQVDAHRPVRRPVGQAALQRRELHRRRHPGNAPSPDLDAHRHGPVHRQAGPPGARPDDRSTGAHPAALQGQGRPRQRPRHRAVLPVLRCTRSRSGRRTSPRPSSCCRTPARADLKATLHAGQLLEIPDLAVLLQSQAAQAGITLNAGRREPQHRSTARSGARPNPPIRRAPAPPSSASSTTATARPRTSTSTPRSRRRASGTRRSTPRRSSTPAFTEFQSAVGVDAQKAACAKIEAILNEDAPISLPYFYNYLSGNSKKFTGVYSQRPRTDVLLGRRPRPSRTTHAGDGTNHRPDVARLACLTPGLR